MIDDKLIDRAAEVFCDSSAQGMRWNQLGEAFKDIYRVRIRKLADAGFLTGPDQPTTAAELNLARGRIELALSWIDDPDDATPELQLRKIYAALTGSEDEHVRAAQEIDHA